MSECFKVYFSAESWVSKYKSGILHGYKMKMERYLRINLLGSGPRLMKKEFTGPRSHKGRETLTQSMNKRGNKLF